MDGADVPSTSGRDLVEPLKDLESMALEGMARAASSLQRQREAVEPAIEPLTAVLGPAWMLGGAAAYLGLPYSLWMPAATGAALGGLYVMLFKYCQERVWKQPKRPLNVVVTGGSKGLGKALARELLAHGDRVVVTSRTAEGAAAAARELRAEVGGEAQVHGVACDVGSPGDVAALGREVRRVFGGDARVDAWINNAGYSGSFQSFAGASQEQVEQVVRTNLLGTMLCTKEAASIFTEQGQPGHVFNMDGAGADGFATPQYAAYGSTKAGIAQFTKSLQQELKDTQVKAHTMSPGMVLTDLLLDGATIANKQAFNILCEQPETVAAFLVPRLRCVVGNDHSDTYVRYLTPSRILGKFLTAPMRIGKFFDADGNPIYPDERSRLLGKYARVTARRSARARSRGGALTAAYSMAVLACVVALLVDAGAANAGM